MCDPIEAYYTKLSNENDKDSDTQHRGLMHSCGSSRQLLYQYVAQSQDASSDLTATLGSRPPGVAIDGANLRRHCESCENLASNSGFE